MADFTPIQANRAYEQLRRMFPPDGSSRNIITGETSGNTAIQSVATPVPSLNTTVLSSVPTTLNNNIANYQTLSENTATQTNTTQAPLLIPEKTTSPSDAPPSASLPSVTGPSSSISEPSLSTCSAENMIDPRIRLMAYPGHEQEIYGTGIMNILNTTGGLLFPYTPAITHTYSVDYSDISMVHSNQDYRVYNSTKTVRMTINGQFTAQNQKEAEYSLAAIHFIRTTSKMYFGKRESLERRGLPPPVLILHGYGKLIYSDLPVILIDANYNFDRDVDYIDYSGPCGAARVPMLWQLTITLEVQNTPKRWREEFLLDDFRSGALLSSTGNRKGGLAGGWV